MNQKAYSTEDFFEWLRLERQQQPGLNYYLDQAETLLCNANSETDWIELSRSYNGYIRELAVCKLFNRPSADALQALLERVNDWVPAVRERALQGVERYLNEEGSDLLLQSIPQILALTRQQRDDHQPLIDRVQAILVQPGIAEQVESAWFSMRGPGSRFLFEILVADSPSPELLDKALRHADPIVRLSALQASKLLPEAQRLEFLQKSLGNRSAVIRAKALLLLLQSGDVSQAMLQQLLLDDSASVRSIVLWHAPRYELDARRTLQERLQGEKPSTFSHWRGILSLCLTLNEKPPMDWLDYALGSKSVRVRLAAVALLDDDDLERLLHVLDDPSPKVFKQVLSKLSQYQWQTLQEPLTHYLDQNWTDLDKFRREALLHQLAYWQQLAYLFRRLDKSDQPEYWLRMLSLWCRNPFPAYDAMTTPEEKQVLSARVEQLVANGTLSEWSLNSVR